MAMPQPDIFLPPHDRSVTPLIDPLTGLATRRMLVHHLQSLLDQGDTPAAVCIIDVRGLQTLNHTQGVERGDEVLRLVGQTLTATIRRKDLVGRLGEDEFAVVLVNADATVAARVLQRVLHNVETCGVTVTAGVALYPVHGTSPADLLRRADIAREQADCRQLDFVIWNPVTAG